MLQDLSCTVIAHVYILLNEVEFWTGGGINAVAMVDKTQLEFGELKMEDLVLGLEVSNV